MNKTQDKLQQEVSTKAKKCLTLSLVVVSLLSITKMILSNRASNWGNQLKSIRSQILIIEQENLHLKSQLAQQSGGLTTLAEVATEAGFTDKPHYKYFNSAESVAQIFP